MKKSTTLLLSLLFSSLVTAQTLPPTVPESSPALEPAESLSLEKPESRPPPKEYKYWASLNYAVFDFPILSKLGATAAYREDADHFWELQYMKGSLGYGLFFSDIASITDTKISLLRRVYYGGSFNWTYGVSYFDFSARIGDAAMNSVSGSYPSADVLRLQGLGAQVGFGNSWVIKDRYIVGVDWLSVAQPLLSVNKEAPFLDYSNDPDYRDKVETALNAVSYIPRVSLLQIYFAMMF